MTEEFASKRVNLDTTASEVCRLGIAFAVVKIIKCIGFFESYDLLKSVSILQFLFVIKIASSVVFLLLKRSSLRLKKSLVVKVIQHSCLGLLIDFIYLFGLTLCGPLRTILVYEHSAPILIAMISGLFSRANYARTRGSILFILGVMTLLLFDTDVFSQSGNFPDLKETNVFFSFLYVTSSAFGVADHKSGVFLLLFLLLIKIVHHSFSKRLAVQVGGSNKLHMYSTYFSAILLTPVYLFSSFNGYQKTDILSNIWPMIFIAIFVFIADRYSSNYMASKMNGLYSYKIGYISVSVFALFLGFQWNHPAAIAITKAHDGGLARTQDHIMSGGVVVSAVFFILSSDILSWSGHKSRKGNFVGYSSEGTPLYSFAENVLSRASSSSVVSVSRSFFKQIFERNDSRHIFYFLCLNLSFAFVELFWGMYTNSLGLISDSFHMMFDSTSLVLGLLASVISRWKPSRSFPYGFGRVEVLSGFVNSLFLLAISIFLVYEGSMRIMDPPQINTDKLLTVSVSGFVVNLVGAYLLGHNHHHGHNHGHGHSHNHGHSHHHQHQGSCDGHSHKHENINLRGVYLHILTDLLGSVGVIISAVLVKKYELYIADPICTLFIAVFILYSLVPLLLTSARILTLSLSSYDKKNVENALKKVSSLDGVTSLHSCHVWEHGSGDFRAAFCLTVESHVTEQRVITQATSILREHGVGTCTIQVEKDDYYQHLSGLKMGSEEIHAPRSLNSSPNIDFAKLI